MRVCMRACLVALLAAGLLNLPAFAANDSPLGMIIQAEGLAHLGPAKAAIGSTVYPGDSVFTESGGTMRMRVGTSQVYLLSDSSASLAQYSDMVHVVVAKGTVGFQSPANQPIALDTPLGLIRPAQGQPTFGQVVVTSPIEMTVTAFHGDLVVEENGNLHTIPEGKAFRITTDLEPSSQPNSAAQTPQGSGTHVKRARSGPPIIVEVAIVAGVAGASWAIWDKLCESPSRMHCYN